jgi:hypothetical protein
MTHPIRGLVGAVAFALIAVIGCGPSKRGNVVSGNVTYAGQPLVAGMVQFQPVDATGTSVAPSTAAAVVGGRYETPRNRGVGTGPYIARVLPCDVTAGAPLPPGAVQFFPYELQVELPDEPCVVNIDVPEGGGIRPK